jgi:hypothetical protein
MFVFYTDILKKKRIRDRMDAGRKKGENHAKRANM